jgi:hypothetical protein
MTIVLIVTFARMETVIVLPGAMLSEGDPVNCQELLGLSELKSFSPVVPFDPNAT